MIASVMIPDMAGKPGDWVRGSVCTIPPIRHQRGTPLPLERQGGGGPSLMKPRGYPLPIPFLGDDLSSVSDVNPCRKTGGGATLGTLVGGACQRQVTRRRGYPHPSGAPDRHPPPQKIGGGWGLMTLRDRATGSGSDVKPFPENGVYPHPRVPGRGVPLHARWREGGGGCPGLKKIQPPPSPDREVYPHPRVTLGVPHPPYLDRVFRNAMMIQRAWLSYPSRCGL